jgi:O-antigen ligase
LAMLVLTQHRSVILAGGLGVALIFYLYRINGIVVSRLILILITVFTVIILVIFSVPSFEDRTMHYLSGIINPTSDMTASWRIEGWRQQLSSLSLQEWLFGKGMGNYFIWFYKGTEVMVEPHNGYVQLILKFGLVGLMIYVLLVVTFFGKVMAMRRKLPPGPIRAFLDVSILNFGASHAFLMGYGFTPIILIFYAMGMSAVRLAGIPGESASPHRYDTLDHSQGFPDSGVPTAVKSFI